MKIVTVLGARPQFIKASPVSRALAASGHVELLLHTGQHFDDNMSDVFFRELALAKPHINLGVGSGSHAAQTAKMLTGIEETLVRERPDWLLVYGDTNSTIAGALAACKLQIRIAHVEAGLRSFNRSMPEEHNRILTDHCADLLLCPTRVAMDHLASEGLQDRSRLVGDTMYDAVLAHRDRARSTSTALERFDLVRGGYALATVHRPYNTDHPEALSAILRGLAGIGMPVVFPVHPRTRQKISMAGLDALAPEDGSVRLIEPLGYLDMLALQDSARFVLTDSGGVQKEAYFLGVPCITMRPETEWVETVASGWNVLVGADANRIVEAATTRVWPTSSPPASFGDGRAAEKIVQEMEA